jgi:hypothetical protein
MKKTFNNLKDLVEGILRIERENKADHSADRILITNGPMDLFKLLTTTFEIIKHKNIKAMQENFLELCKETIINYLIGIDSCIDVKF